MFSQNKGWLPFGDSANLPNIFFPECDCQQLGYREQIPAKCYIGCGTLSMFYKRDGKTDRIFLNKFICIAMRVMLCLALATSSFLKDSSNVLTGGICKAKNPARTLRDDRFPPGRRARVFGLSAFCASTLPFEMRGGCVHSFLCSYAPSFNRSLVRDFLTARFTSL